MPKSDKLTGSRNALVKFFFSAVNCKQDKRNKRDFSSPVSCKHKVLSLYYSTASATNVAIIVTSAAGMTKVVVALVASANVTPGVLEDQPAKR